MSEQKIGLRVNEEIHRVSQETLDRVAEFSPSDLCDGTIVYNAMDYTIKPMVTTKKICGQAVTLKLTMGDSLLVTRALACCKPGDVLVIDGRGSCNNALWGDHRSLAAKYLGLSGVVIDGAFRDIEENEAIGFPIYAKAVCVGSSTKNSHGEVNVPISCGGVTVNPGDIIVGDRNGVTVVPLDCIEQILEGAAKKNKSMKALTEQIHTEMKIIPDNFAAAMKKLGYEL